MLIEFDIPQKEIDMTPYENRNNTYSFSENEVENKQTPFRLTYISNSI